jgi:transposase-like protein
MAACGLTPEVRARVLAAATRGVSIKLVAEASGVPEDTLNGWLYRSRHTDSKHLRGFAEEFDRARGVAAINAVDQIRDAASGAGSGDWRAAAWFLERTRGDEFGARVYLQLAREQVTDAIIERLRGALDSDTYARVLHALSLEEGEGGDRGDGSDTARILEAELVRSDT